MSRTSRLLSCALLATMGSWSWPSRSSPSVWTQAARPEERRRSLAEAEAEKALSADALLRARGSKNERARALNRARLALERSGAAAARHPSGHYRLAQIYYHLHGLKPDGQRLLRRAIRHFEVVAKSDAPVTVRSRALNSLAICHARLQAHAREIASYEAALELEPDSGSRAAMLANQAEGYMANGAILKAVRRYRASLAVTLPHQMLKTGVTTLWGLGVALDRSGDLAGGLEQVARARRLDRFDLRLNSADWFFVPSYDRHWYQALGHWQQARTQPEAAKRGEKPADHRNEAYERAIAAWRAYIEQALQTDPWLPLASWRLQQCEQERRRLR